MANQEKWQELIDIMARLRGAGGCPWDREQDHISLKRYLLEEAYEVLDAIDAGDDAAFCDELGDVLLQIVFHAQIATEQERFTIDDVVDGISAKMIRRHPHIFGAASAESSEQVLTMWEQIKAAERNPDGEGSRGLMKLNENLPALMLAQKAQEKAARVGFDWPDTSGPADKLEEELAELAAAATTEEKAAELGDVLFSLVNMARFWGVDAEDALRRCVRRFIGRCDYMDKVIEGRGETWQQLTLTQLDEIWDEAKEHQQ
jgi:tetrapyrrole methylase family protein / MazG family protein